MTNRSSRGSDKPAVSQALRARQTDWNPIRGLHQGQRPLGAASTGRTHDRTRPKRHHLAFPLAPKGPSTHETLPKHWTNRICAAFISSAGYFPILTNKPGEETRNMVCRSEINQALANVIAYKICRNQAAASDWARRLVNHLGCTEILNSFETVATEEHLFSIAQNNDSAPLRPPSR
jgi:hypothetical protein